MNTTLSAWLLSATAFALAMSGTPGPNNTMLTASGATFGFARTIPHMLGVAAGLPLMLLAIAIGAGDVMRANPVIHDVLKWAGAAYLVYLAYRIATAHPMTEAAATSGSGARPLTFLQGALFQWINPKAWIVAISGLATYTGTGAAAWLAEAIGLSIIFLVVAVPTTACWSMAGVLAARVLRGSPALRAFNVAMAALLIASLVPMLRDV